MDVVLQRALCDTACAPCSRRTESSRIIRGLGPPVILLVVPLRVLRLLRVSATTRSRHRSTPRQPVLSTAHAVPVSRVAEQLTFSVLPRRRSQLLRSAKSEVSIARRMADEQVDSVDATRHLRVVAVSNHGRR